MIFLLLARVLQIYTFVLLIRILITWIPNLDPYHPIVQLLFQVTEPVLEPARKLIPPIGMIDISPIVVFIVLGILQDLLMQLAY
ncbi:MAG: YggT family protein [Caldilineaceae bacterium]|uniref:YggT family protein n=3 Tax=unclassified Caldilineaceae TaxID=1919254 RepID=A0A6B1G5X8_9CHLR|nr:YggT family protein [Caldilineaceae bacterium]MXX27540.1 YggT family protein [Caldilineaceae bacterium SB0668_bin_21]MXY93219.1 YggT family protein [Caldilineaceae bacterium SB0664_bin_27]MXZ20073.1 YggT family protein [Caldilineaceae bacterium SB0665_bin_25]MYC23508.1 YggT family protein [Caldilineaceae bacterium SB0662_bin_25]MYC95882.1 YggT family protein [Caldilineaceae bacterium SB0661_bin_32]MYH63827.1 YggT family protein [Caldilineaceae bacterium SB0675_bin_29]MYJ77307.1 YggT famil